MKSDMSNQSKKALKGAIFSLDKLYRYELWREWDPNKKSILFIGLNPSTADEIQDDPTIRRCINYSKLWGFGKMFMGNLFAFRSTNPKQLHQVINPIGRKNDVYLLQMAINCDMIILAWGDKGIYMNRAENVIKLLKLNHSDKLYYLGLTSKHSQPRHPLYQRRDIKPIFFFD